MGETEDWGLLSGHNLDINIPCFAVGRCVATDALLNITTTSITTTEQKQRAAPISDDTSSRGPMMKLDLFATVLL
jgi:hypothetical protein